ncbi:MAG: hypothetical protein JWO06_1828, partial [Bacteroidota bacterium]|nr:hypothetical protein [Bacteroidota bacterium]
LGDRLSYYQDAVATEAYIATMRRRISARRHARLLDYIAHDGCNARVWVQIQTDQKNIVILQSTMLMASSIDKLIVDQNEAEKLLRETDSVAFETMHDITLYNTQNQISFYTWWDSNCCLPVGSTRATLLNEPELFLAEGDVLIFEEIRSPVTGAEADADPNHRCAVRLTSVNKNLDKLTNLNVLDIEWYSGDALPFALCLTTTNSDGGQFEISVARGNIVLADYGATQNNKQLNPAAANGQKYYPMLADKNVTTIVAYDHNIEKTNPASVTILQDPHKALPTVRLSYQQQTWQAQKDLLNSDKFATEFVVETESDGTSYLRFGDGISGRKPDNGFFPNAKYRVGNGNDGNVGAEAINTIAWNQGGIINVRNPLPARGGTEAETIEQIRQYAPQAFRTQERAVVESDYVEKAKLHPEVQNAAARFYWTGSWYTVYIIIDRLGGKDIDGDFKQELVVLLDQYRMAGYDLEIIQTTFVPLNITLNVCIKPGYFQADVKQSLLRVFSNSLLPDGTKGFFHPDNFTFGQPVYLSAIYAVALAVDGVLSVEIKTFQRWAKNPDDEIKNGLIKASALEILRLDNDQSLPENGKIDFIMLNGL